MECSRQAIAVAERATRTAAADRERVAATRFDWPARPAGDMAAGSARRGIVSNLFLGIPWGDDFYGSSSVACNSV